MVAAAVVGSAVVGAAASSQASKSASKAANNAAAAQSESNAQAVEEQRRQYDEMVQLLQPYTQAGNQSLNAQQNLLGLNGVGAQQNAINNIANGAEYQTYLQQGTNNILQNASATGGLRGGNTQNAIAQFAPNLLNNLVNQQYQNLGGMTTLGQNSAAQTGNAGMASANNISSLLQNTGSANAAAYMAKGNAQAAGYNGMAGSLSNGLGAYAGLSILNNNGMKIF